MKRAKKKGLKSGNSTKRIVLHSIIVITSPKRKKKRSATVRSRQTRPSCTGKHLQKNENAKCEHINNKMHEPMHNMTAKNKASTQMHIQCQRAKKQASKQTNNCARRMSQHAENAET